MPVEFSSDDVSRLRMALGRTVRALDRWTNLDDLTRTQLTVLGTVVRKGRIPVAELAEFEAINPTMLSRIVGKLDEAGLITRVTDPVDRRGVTVEVTKAGKRTQERVRDERNHTLTVLLEAMPADQAAAVLSALPALEALSLGLMA